MRPAPFRYIRPSSLADACAILTGENGSRLLAGGQSLLPLLTHREQRVSQLVDISRLGELRSITPGAHTVEVGASITQHELERHPALEGLPLVRNLVASIGSLPIRHRGTIGGSLAFADPTGELPLALTALQGWVRVRGSDTTREVSANDLWRGGFATSLAPNEILTAVIWPRTEISKTRMARFVHRRRIKLSVITEPCDIGLHVTVSGLIDRPCRVSVVGDSRDKAATEVVAACLALGNPLSDRFGSTRYRQQVVKGLLNTLFDELEMP